MTYTHTTTSREPHMLVDVGSGLWISPVDIVAIRLSVGPSRKDHTFIWLRGVPEPLTCDATPTEVMSRCQDARQKLADGDWP